MGRFNYYTSIHITRTDWKGDVTRQVGCSAPKIDNCVVFDIGLIADDGGGYLKSSEKVSFAVDSIETMRLLARVILDEADRLDGQPEAHKAS